MPLQSRILTVAALGFGGGGAGGGSTFDLVQITASWSLFREHKVRLLGLVLFGVAAALIGFFGVLRYGLAIIRLPATCPLAFGNLLGVPRYGIPLGFLWWFLSGHSKKFDTFLLTF